MRSTKRKSKATIPKPPRGSGLNPLGLLANDQLNLLSEQLRMPENMFNPHDGAGGWSNPDTAPQFRVDENGDFDLEALYGPTAASSLNHQGQPNFDADQDGNPNVGLEPLHGPTASSSNPHQQMLEVLNPYAHASAPLPRWTTDSPDAGVHLVLAYKPTELTRLWRGEIPPSDVVHGLQKPQDV
ncbi:hypothetical protein BDR07DRAFT_1025026 [Suillus spraguei]|nr:hypothetical protein BDR07DRAFT_1025026 [Suillus spraguei]